MSFMSSTKCGAMESIPQSIVPLAFRVYEDKIMHAFDYLHVLQFWNDNGTALLYEYGLLLTANIGQIIEFYLHPKEEIDGKQMRMKVVIQFVEEWERTQHFAAKRLAYHSNLLSLLGYDESLNVNTLQFKNCVTVPLHQRHLQTMRLSQVFVIDPDIVANIVSFLPILDEYRMDVIAINPWSEFVNIFILILCGEQLTLSMIEEAEEALIALFGNQNCRIDSVKQLDKMPFFMKNDEMKNDDEDDTPIFMIKFVISIDTNTQNKNIQSDLFKMSTMERWQRTGFHLRFNDKLIAKALKYPSNDLRFALNHRGETMLQYSKWPTLKQNLLRKSNQNLSDLVVRIPSSNSYYTDLRPTELTLQSLIGAGIRYLDYFQNKMGANYPMDEDEALYSAQSLSLRPEDATIHNSVHLKPHSQRISIPPQICHIVPVNKTELFYSRFLVSALWKFENVLRMNEMKNMLDVCDYNLHLLLQCCSLPSIDRVFHAQMGRVYFLGNQLVKYCAAIEAYSKRKTLNQSGLSKFVHLKTSNANLSDRAKANHFLHYFVFEPFDAKKYEIANFSALNETNIHQRVSKKCIADMIEAMAVCTFYNDHIAESSDLSQQIMDKCLGELDLNKMKICNDLSICKVREFIGYFLQFSFFDQPTFPSLFDEITISKKLFCFAWKFVVGDGYKQITKCLKEIKQKMENNTSQVKEFNDPIDKKDEMNVNLNIPPCIDKHLGIQLYASLISFYNKHCIDAGNECTKYLMKRALCKCMSSLFVFGESSLFYKNDFSAIDVENSLALFGVLCNDTFPIFALIDSERVMAIESILHFKFHQTDLIFAATTHSAFNTDKGVSFCNYQRLEFIGDAAIGVCVSQHLFQHFINFEQGKLSHVRSAMVSNHYLARKLMKRFKSKGLDIKQFITIISAKDREEICAYIDRFDYEADDFLLCLDLLVVSRRNQPLLPKILADIYEALVGAILIDANGSLEVVWDVIKEDFALNDTQINQIDGKYIEAQLISDRLCK